MMNDDQLKQFTLNASLTLAAYMLHRKLDEKESEVLTLFQDALDIIDEIRQHVYGGC